MTTTLKPLGKGQDDRPQIMSALNKALKTGGKVKFSKWAFLLSRPLQVKPGMEIEGLRMKMI